jgi:hypothetical protein
LLKALNEAFEIPLIILQTHPYAPLKRGFVVVFQKPLNVNLLFFDLPVKLF